MFTDADYKSFRQTTSYAIGCLVGLVVFLLLAACILGALIYAWLAPLYA